MRAADSSQVLCTCEGSETIPCLPCQALGLVREPARILILRLRGPEDLKWAVLAAAHPRPDLGAGGRHFGSPPSSSHNTDEAVSSISLADGICEDHHPGPGLDSSEGAAILSSHEIRLSDLAPGLASYALLGDWEETLTKSPLRRSSGDDTKQVPSVETKGCQDGAKALSCRPA